MTIAVDNYQVLAIGAAVVAIMMLGTTHLKGGLYFYALSTVLCAGQAVFAGGLKTQAEEYFVPVLYALFKGIGVPWFLTYVMKTIEVDDDVGTYLPPPLCMHIGILMLGVSYILASHMPGVIEEGDLRIGGMAAMSMLFTGMLLMLTRKLAISQLIGFLVMENGIYVFACSHTNGMPMLVEMGILLDVLVGVIVAGLLFNSIKKSFEHIDVTRLTDLKD